MYPNPYDMTRDQLIDYLTFIEAQAITKEFDLVQENKYLKNVIKKLMEKQN